MDEDIDTGCDSTSSCSAMLVLERVQIDVSYSFQVFFSQSQENLLT